MRQRVLLKIVLGIITLVLGSGASLVLAFTASDVRSLTGVASVNVLIENLNSAMQNTGLRKEQLQAIAEQELRKNGITVRSPEDPGKGALVYVRLSSVIGGEAKDAPISFYLVVQVKQLAVLANGVRVARLTAAEPGVTPLLVTTWENGTMAMVGRSELFFYVQHTLVNLIGDLVRAQQEANGMKPSN